MEKEYVLLIWEETPEFNLFLIPTTTLTEEYLNILEESHGKYINSDDLEDSHPIWRLNAMVCDKKEYCEEDIPEKYHMIWSQYEQDMSTPISVPICKVYACGFYC